MILFRSIAIIALSVFTVHTARWSQYVFGSDDKCSNIQRITQSVEPDNAFNVCSGASGACLATGSSSRAATCFDGAPKGVPEQAKTGQWVQTKSYVNGECSSDPSLVTYHKADACFPSLSGKWTKYTCGGNAAIAFECTDDRCTKCSEVGTTQINLCDTKMEAGSLYKARFSTCLNSGQQQQAGPSNSARRNAPFCSFR